MELVSICLVFASLVGLIGLFRRAKSLWLERLFVGLLCVALVALILVILGYR